MPGRIKVSPVTEIKEEKDLPSAIKEINDNFKKIERGLGTLGMCFGYRVTVAVASASTDTEVEHNLGVVPDAYTIVSSTIPCRVWDGDTTWTSTSIWIQADKAVTLKLLVFVDTN